MSRIENIITTTFRAHGGNVIATVGQMGGNLRSFGRIINENTQMSSRLNQQWRAFGTTIRYALAGSVIFGAGRLVTQIRDINQQLGQMQALSGIGGTAFSNQQVNTLGNALQKTALDTITPLNEVNDAAINFLSTVQNVDPAQIPAMLTLIGQGAKLAKTPIEDLTQAATTFQVAFGRMVDPTSVGQFTRMWTQLIGVAPGVVSAAPTIAQAIPGLASMFQLAPGRNANPATSQAQLMSLTLGVLRTGMPPATAMRGLTYFLQSIAQPTPQSAKALAGIGITPQSVVEQGIYPNAMKLLGQISTRPGVAQRLAVMPDETIDQIDQEGGSLPGVSAQEMVRLRKMIPRIHGIRAAIILASQMQQHGNVQSLGGDLDMMLQAQNENSDVTKKLAQAWNDLSSRSRLQEATVALNTMGIQVASMFNPVFDFVSSGIAQHLAPWMQNNRGTAQKAVVGSAAFLGALTVGRALNVGNLPGLRNIPGMRGLLTGGSGRGFIAAQAAEAAITGGHIRGDSPQFPIFVTVVGEIFGSPASGGPSGTDPVPVPGSKLRGLKRVAPWIAAAAMRGATVGGALTVGAGLGTAALVASMESEHQSYSRRFRHAAARVDPHRFPNLAKLIARTGREDYTTFDANQRNLLLKLERGQITPGQAARILRGRADVHVQIQQVDANGRVIQQKRVKVPLDMQSGGRVPKTRGRAGKGTRG